MAQHNLSIAHKVPKHPAFTEQAMPNPTRTSPRVCQLPKGAGARFAGLNKLFFWDLILISVNCGLAPVTASARIAQIGSNVARRFYLLHCARVPTFAEIGPIYFGLWCAENGVLNQFSHSLLIEIPWRDSLLAMTDISTQDRQGSAVGVVSAGSAWGFQARMGN